MKSYQRTTLNKESHFKGIQKAAVSRYINGVLVKEVNSRDFKVQNAFKILEKNGSTPLNMPYKQYGAEISTSHAVMQALGASPVSGGKKKIDFMPQQEIFVPSNPNVFDKERYKNLKNKTFTPSKSFPNPADPFYNLAGSAPSRAMASRARKTKELSNLINPAALVESIFDVNIGFSYSTKPTTLVDKNSAERNVKLMDNQISADKRRSSAQIKAPRHDQIWTTGGTPSIIQPTEPDILLRNISARNISARDIRTGRYDSNDPAGNNISARNISARDMTAQSAVIASLRKIQHSKRRPTNSDRSLKKSALQEAYTRPIRRLRGLK